MNLDFLGDANTVVGSIIAALGTIGFAKIWNYWRKRHDTLLKTTYDVDALFQNYEGLKKSVDEQVLKNNEIGLAVKENSAKIDALIQENKETQKAFRKVIDILYRHEHDLSQLNGRRPRRGFYNPRDQDDEGPEDSF